LIDKKTIFILGAGASCPYGYPSGARLRELICYDVGFIKYYREFIGKNKEVDQSVILDVQRFKDAFAKSNIKSIDMFMANNPKLAPIGKYIISFEVFRAEHKSLFGENAKQGQEERMIPSDSRIRRDYIRGTTDFQGGDWYSYLFNRFLRELPKRDSLPDFLGDNNEIVFITFNYDRSLEYFLYEALRNSFTEVPEDRIVNSLKQFEILHVYGQVAPLKWQNPEDYVDYKPQTDESLLQKAANNIRTIYEEKENPELIEAQSLLKQADEILFLGFGFARENMEVLGLPGLIPQDCQIFGTVFELEPKEISDIRDQIVKGLKPGGLTSRNLNRVKLDNVDCLKLLRNYL